MTFKVGDCVKWRDTYDPVIRGIILKRERQPGSWCFKVHWFHPEYSDDWNTDDYLELII